MSNRTRNLTLKERANEIANAIRFSRNTQHMLNTYPVSDHDQKLINVCTSYRNNVLSVESRCMNLAKACMADVPYKTVEANTYSLTNGIIYRTAEICFEHRPEHLTYVSFDDVYAYISFWFDYEEIDLQE